MFIVVRTEGEVGDEFCGNGDNCLLQCCSSCVILSVFCLASSPTQSIKTNVSSS